MKPGAGPLQLSELSAAVLVGGLGTRLRGAVPDRPKVLAEVRGRPFLFHLLDQLQEAGIQRALLCTGYQGARVKAVCGERFGRLDLFYSQEKEPLGTAGALRFALPLLDTDPVLVLNGDSYCDADLNDFFSWHRVRDAQASLLLVSVKNTERYGQVGVAEDGRVTRFEEKAATGGSGWINAGVYLLGRALLSSIGPGAVSIERDVFPSWIGRSLYGYRKEARFLDIGTPESYGMSEEFFRL